MESQLGVRTEFINPDQAGVVLVVSSEDQSVLVQVIKPDGLTYTCLAWARREWMRADGTGRQEMYEARPGANRYAVSTWSEAVAYARSLVHGPSGL